MEPTAVARSAMALEPVPNDTVKNWLAWDKVPSAVDSPPDAADR